MYKVAETWRPPPAPQQCHVHTGHVIVTGRDVGTTVEGAGRGHTAAGWVLRRDLHKRSQVPGLNSVLLSVTSRDTRADLGVEAWAAVTSGTRGGE